MKTEELQELIDSVVNWYEIKYPERELEYFEGIKNMNFQDIRRISDVRILDNYYLGYHIINYV